MSTKQTDDFTTRTIAQLATAVIEHEAWGKRVVALTETLAKERGMAMPEAVTV